MRTLHTTFLEKPDFQEWLKEAKKAREWVTSHSQSAGDDEEVGEEEDTETKRSKKIKWSTKSNVWEKHKERLISPAYRRRSGGQPGVVSQAALADLIKKVCEADALLCPRAHGRAGRGRKSPCW